MTWQVTCFIRKHNILCILPEAHFYSFINKGRSFLTSLIYWAAVFIRLMFSISRFFFCCFVLAKFSVMRYVTIQKRLTKYTPSRVLSKFNHTNKHTHTKDKKNLGGKVKSDVRLCYTLNYDNCSISLSWTIFHAETLYIVWCSAATQKDTKYQSFPPPEYEKSVHAGKKYK